MLSIVTVKGLQLVSVFIVKSATGFGYTKIVSLAVSEPHPNTDETINSTI